MLISWGFSFRIKGMNERGRKEGRKEGRKRKGVSMSVVHSK
jgi:hypothetical protein